MNELKFEEDVLTKRLSVLPPKHQVVFAACCAERLCPAYEIFEIDVNLNNVDKTLKDYLNAIWESLVGRDDPYINWEDIFANCLALLPSEDAQGIDSAAYAEDAVAATCYTINAIITQKPVEVAWAARRAYEAVDQYVIRQRRLQCKEPFNEKEILFHPACQRELQRQLRDLVDLENVNNLQLTPEFINLLRTRAISDSESVFNP